MAASIILELQSLSIDRENDITDLLRKALLVASKLKLDDFKNWVNNELNGYGPNEVPEYRVANSEIKFDNPYNGLIPVIIEDPKVADAITAFDITNSIESIENLLSDESNQGSFFTFKLPHALEIYLMQKQDLSTKMPVVRIVGRNQLAGVVDSVRTKILEWSLQLESEGILGDGIMFSKKEVKTAMSSSEINITNFQGVLGDVSNSNLNQNLSIAVKKNDFESLSKYLENQGVSKEDLEALKLAIKDDLKPVSSGVLGEKVSGWIGKMVGKSAEGSWSIAIGAAGNMLATALSKYYGI